MTGPATLVVSGAVIGIVLAALPQGSSAAEGPAVLRIEKGDSALSVLDGDRLVLQYAWAKAPFKPYVRQFCSPGGVNVLRDAPHDHLHHHALMLAVGIDGVDFWSEVEGCGRQVHREFADVKTGQRRAAAWAAFTETLDWTKPSDEKPLARETRSVEVYRGVSLGASLMVWRSRLQPSEGRASIKLGGSHYFGLGMRFLQSMDAGGTFFTAEGPVDGEVVRGDERLTRGTWCAYAAEADGRPVTAAMFDSPDNPRPVLWFTMTKPFAYLSATMNYYCEPLTVEAGKPLSLCYGVAVWDAKAKAHEIEKLYKQWLELSRGESARP
jgi:hypothetical protein